MNPDLGQHAHKAVHRRGEVRWLHPGRAARTARTAVAAAGGDPMSTDQLTDVAAAYQRGRADQADLCARHNVTRVARILDLIDVHAGDPEALRAAILEALEHGGPR